MFRFLLVDDSRVMRRMLQNALTSSGYDTSEFLESADGEHAIEQLEAVDYDVDVVFCDLCMPVLDGLGFIEALAERGKIDQVPVIVCTGDIRETRGRDALAKGARKLICKPFSVESVLEALREVLQEQRG